MQPAPDRTPAVTDADLDEVIQQIDQALPRIHRMCKLQKKQKKAPTSRLPEDAQRRMRELSEDPIFTDNGTDTRSEVLDRINGFHQEESEED